MKQDKLILTLQYFFRILALSVVPGAFVWLAFSVSCFMGSGFLLESLFQGQKLGAVPAIPINFTLICLIFTTGSFVAIVLYNHIAKLIKEIRENGTGPNLIKGLKFLSWLFLFCLFHDIAIFILFNINQAPLAPFMQALTLIRPVIDWYHFIYIEFTGITNFALFMIIRGLIRFLEYHYQLKTEAELTV